MLKRAAFRVIARGIEQARRRPLPISQHHRKRPLVLLSKAAWENRDDDASASDFKLEKRIAFRRDAPRHRERLDARPLLVAHSNLPLVLTHVVSLDTPCSRTTRTVGAPPNIARNAGECVITNTVSNSLRSCWSTSTARRSPLSSSLSKTSSHTDRLIGSDNRHRAHARNEGATIRSPRRRSPFDKLSWVHASPARRTRSKFSARVS